LDDTIGCFVNLDVGNIKFSKNGTDLGVAFEIPKNILNYALYPSICLKNGEVQVNFGKKAFKYEANVNIK
jgi:ATP-dependent RNA helicase DDX1